MTILKSISAVAITIALVSCGGANKELENKLAVEHRNMEVEDSLMEISHAELETAHNTMKDEHGTVANGQDSACIAMEANHDKLIAVEKF